MYGLLPCGGASALTGKANGKKEGVGAAEAVRNV